MVKYTVFLGDSWSCGEWKNQQLQHNGLRQYLEDNNKHTLCFGTPGFGNFPSIEKFLEFKNNNPYINISQIIFFQSDWIRDISTVHVSKDVYTQGYEHTRDYYVHRLYYWLSKIYNDFNIPSLLIGGQSDTAWFDDFEKEYPGVSIGCQSFSNFIEFNSTKIDDPIYSVFRYGRTQSKWVISDEMFFDFLTTLKNHSSTNDIKLLLKDTDLAEQRSKFFEKSDLFPDRMHPDRSCHLKLYHYLTDNKLIL